MGSWENGVWTWALKWRGWFVWEEQQANEFYPPTSFPPHKKLLKSLFRSFLWGGKEVGG